MTTDAQERQSSRGLRARTIARLDDAVSAVRACAEGADPRTAVELLRVLARLQAERATFVQLTGAGGK